MHSVLLRFLYILISMFEQEPGKSVFQGGHGGSLLTVLQVLGEQKARGSKTVAALFLGKTTVSFKALRELRLCCVEAGYTAFSIPPSVGTAFMSVVLSSSIVSFAASTSTNVLQIFLVMGGTVITYLLIFLSIRAKARGSSQTTIRSNDSDPAVLLRATKYMVIFPVAYVVLTLPLAGGRMAAMTGVKIPFAYYCAAGAAITSCGWVDVTLYVLTRRVLVFGHAPPARDDFGFDTLGWRHGGQNDFFGTTTTIEGPLTPKPKYRRKEGRFLRRSTDRPLRTRHSDEDYFASPDPGTITTKTTVEVSTGAMPHYASSDPKYYAGSDLSIIELEDKPPRTQSPRFSNNHWLEISEENQARRS